MDVSYFFGCTVSFSFVVVGAIFYVSAAHPEKWLLIADAASMDTICWLDRAACCSQISIAAKHALRASELALRPCASSPVSVGCSASTLSVEYDGWYASNAAINDTRRRLILL